MTRITLLRNEQGQLIGYECRGHADYAPAGRDIVCAAVSMLATACLNALESVAGVQPLVDTGDGYIKALLSPAQASHDAEIILRVFEQGARDIQSTYPKHIHITTR